jgi:hypothetical protein
MPARIPFARSLFALGLLVVASGCVAPGYSSDKEMLFEDKIHIEPRFGVFIPQEGDFSEGTVIATRLSYQYDYGSYLSIDLSATEDVEQEGTAPNVTSVNNIRDLEHLVLSESDRRSAVFSLDWDYPFSENERVPYLRWGIGLGVLNTLNGTNPTVRSDLIALGAGRVSVKDQVMILVRPTLGLFWAPADDLSFFVDAQYDYAESKVRVSVDGEDFKTGVIDFGGINVLVGLSYSF